MHSHTEVHHVREVNLIVHGFLQSIYRVSHLHENVNIPTNFSILTMLSAFLLDTNCTYKFLATPNEQVTIVFDHFKVKADNANVTGGAYG